MSLKVKLYSAMPAVLKNATTRVYIGLRKRREESMAKVLRPPRCDDPKVVYVSGFPRSGTTMLKYYFANFPGLRQTAFTPVGFFDAWKQAEESEEILIDKSNHYIYSLAPLFRACGRGARVLIIIRDPRDCLVSFAKYEENREVPRGETYWRYWANQHADLLEFGTSSGFGDLIYAVRYEDLVRFPEAAKSDFLNWLGFDVDPGDLDKTYRNEHPSEGWHDSVHDHREVGVHALQKWKQAGDDLPRWCRDRLRAWRDDDAVIGMMNQLGYSDDGFEDPKLPEGRIRLFRPSHQR